MENLEVLDLYRGLGGWTKPFEDRGHHVLSLDWEARFNATYTRDILTVDSLKELEQGRRFDVVVASPPCETFSVASIGHHWTGGWRTYQPKTDAARLGLRIMQHTFHLLLEYDAPLWVVENPRGVMRKLAPVPPTTTVWYCRLGETRAKPTDLWMMPSLPMPAPCHNGNPDHEAAPRGAKTGTQGLTDAADRAKIPYALGLTVCLEAEHLLRDDARS